VGALTSRNPTASTASNRDIFTFFTCSLFTITLSYLISFELDEWSKNNGGGGERNFAWPSPPDRLGVRLVPGILPPGLKRSKREVNTLTIKAYVGYFTTASVFTLCKCRIGG
jgi:hypothetical protein